MSGADKIRAHVTQAVQGVVEDHAAKRAALDACQGGVDRLFAAAPELIEKAIATMPDIDGLHIPLDGEKVANRARLTMEDGRPVITMRFHPSYDLRETYHSIGKEAAAREEEEMRVGEPRGGLDGVDIERVNDAQIEKMGIGIADALIKAARGVEGSHRVDWSAAL